MSNNTPVQINLRREVELYNRKYTVNQNAFFTGAERKPEEPRSSFFDPYETTLNHFGTLQTIDRYANRTLTCETLRRVSEKAWLINLCIGHTQKVIRPFLKPSTNKNIRGFVVHKKGEDLAKVAGKSNSKRKEIETFLRNTGIEQDDNRDNFIKYTNKIIRDVLELDQIATEIVTTKAGKPYAFYAVDAGTIEKVADGQYNPYNIKYVQVIDHVPQAFYPQGTLIFDYMNPRTDIRHSNYGYSYVEQAIDLVTSNINTMVYNSSFFTENKLPKGMLLLNGNVSQENVELMEDYLGDLMSGNPSSQWRVPIIPSGTDQGEIKWVALGGNNREMEYQQWLDFLNSAIVALFGCSMEELGLQSSKSQPLIEHNNSPEIESSKSLVMGDMLSFLQDYFNRIIEIFYPEYEMEFVGYEKDDLKLKLDLSKGELESFKTVNEVREENGLKPLESEWADKVPANPQLMQAYQSEQAQGGMGGFGDDEDGDGMGEDMGDYDEESQDEAGEDDEQVNNDAWGEIEDNLNGSSEEPQEENNEDSDEKEAIEKSIKIVL